MKIKNNAVCCLVGLLLFFGLCKSQDILAKEWYVSAQKGSNLNPGTRERPVQSVGKALSLIKPGDSVVFSAGMYPCADEKMPDGHPGMTVNLLSAGDGKVVFSGDGSKDLLKAGSYSSITGIEFNMTGDNPEGNGI